MRQSTILMVGLDGCGSEALKNLVLAGLGQITILEDRLVNQQIADIHFYVASKDIGQPVPTSLLLPFFPSPTTLFFPRTFAQTFLFRTNKSGQKWPKSISKP